MATYRAIAALSDAIAHLLESRFSRRDFDDNQLEFMVYGAKDFGQPMGAGVSVFLYRIYTNNTYRTPSRPIPPAGLRYQDLMPLDLHFLLTAWAPDASLQHTIAGWMMSVLEDTPILPAGLLNHRGEEVFRSDESVPFGVAELETEPLFRIWEVIVSHAYQISVPYVARNVRIESARPVFAGQPVQERTFDYRENGR